MATTQFQELRDLIRPLLGDADSRRRMFSDVVIDSHIRLRILTDNSLDVQEDGTSGVFTEELTAPQKALIIFKVARAIISPIPDSFAYRNPVHSVSRRGGSIQLIAYLDGQIEEVEGGNIRFDTEITAILNGALRFYQDYADAQIADRGRGSDSPSDGSHA
jgi:hypothetical protein